jgi:tyrosine-protein kinase Etk/Wzc
MQPNNDSGLSGRYTESNLSENFEIIVKHRKFIGYIVGSTLILSILISLLLPKMYIATARILPPRENSPGLASLLTKTDDSLSGLAASLMSNQTTAALYVGIMKSRSVADALNQKFKLKELYDVKYIEDVYLRLEDRSTIEISKDNQLISISVRDRDPRRAADMANTYVDMLDQISRKLNITQGKRKRLFLEGRLKKVRSNLENAEMALKAFQDENHLVSIDEQAKAAIEGAAEIKGQIIAAQTQLEVLKQVGTERQIEAVMLKAKIEELQKQLDSIEKSTPAEQGVSKASNSGTNSDFYIPFEDMPRLGMQLMRLTREVKIQEKLFELLTAQYEMARIEEARDVDTIQVLDVAVPAEKKSSPKRLAIVISSVVIAAMVSILLAFLMEFTGFRPTMKARGPGIAQRLRRYIAWTKSEK